MTPAAGRLLHVDVSGLTPQGGLVTLDDGAHLDTALPGRKCGNAVVLIPGTRLPPGPVEVSLRRTGAPADDRQYRLLLREIAPIREAERILPAYGESEQEAKSLCQRVWSLRCGAQYSHSAQGCREWA